MPFREIPLVPFHIHTFSLPAYVQIMLTAPLSGWGAHRRLTHTELLEEDNCRSGASADTLAAGTTAAASVSAGASRPPSTTNSVHPTPMAEGQVRKGLYVVLCGSIPCPTQSSKGGHTRCRPPPLPDCLALACDAIKLECPPVDPYLPCLPLRSPQVEIRLIDFGLACPLSPEDLVHVVEIMATPAVSQQA